MGEMKTSFLGESTQSHGDDLERQTEREVWPIFHAFHLYFHSPTSVFAQLFHSCFYFFSTKECLHKSGGGKVGEKRREGRDTFPISVFRKVIIKKAFQRYTKMRAYPGNRLSPSPILFFRIVQRGGPINKWTENGYSEYFRS